MDLQIQAHTTLVIDDPKNRHQRMGIYYYHVTLKVRGLTAGNVVLFNQYDSIYQHYYVSFSKVKSLSNAAFLLFNTLRTNFWVLY